MGRSFSHEIAALIYGNLLPTWRLFHRLIFSVIYSPLNLALVVRERGQATAPPIRRGKREAGKNQHLKEGEEMYEFVVATDGLELPRRMWFTTVRKYPYETGALVLFKIGSRISIGRLLLNVGGFNWILQPDCLICLIGSAVTILGEIVLAPTIQPCWN
jgi:hypothetical protein